MNHYAYNLHGLIHRPIFGMHNPGIFMLLYYLTDLSYSLYSGGVMTNNLGTRPK